jgi:choline dehydrogenase
MASQSGEETYDYVIVGAGSAGCVLANRLTEDRRVKVALLGGPLAVTDVRMENPLCEAYIAAAAEAGVPRTRDFNGVSQEGVGYYQLTTRDGRRASTAQCYLRTAEKRPNLRVITNAEVEGISLEGKRATGVHCKVNGERRRIAAKREVLLAAGAIGSPQILELSGIGKPEVLKSAGVDVRHALPGVGENLQDHYQVRFIYEMSLPASLNDVWHNPWLKLKTGITYATRRRGILTIGAGVVGLFAKSRPGLEEPDIQFHFMPLSAERPGQGMHEFSGVTSSICVLRPASRGHLHITSPNASDPPMILANYLAEETDRQATLDGMKLARKIAEQPAFRQHLKREVVPGPSTQTDEELLAVAKEKGTTVFHPCGTCKMGSDSTAVVDQRLRVHGLQGLRVIDASIMPTLISGNTNAPTIMIAEKASDMIREDARAR